MHEISMQKAREAFKALGRWKAHAVKVREESEETMGRAKAVLLSNISAAGFGFLNGKLGMGAPVGFMGMEVEMLAGYAGALAAIFGVGGKYADDVLFLSLGPANAWTNREGTKLAMGLSSLLPHAQAAGAMPAGQFAGYAQPAGQYAGYAQPAGQYAGARPAGQYAGARPAGQYR